MTATQTEIEGKATNLRALLLKEKPTLVAAGINVDLFVQVLTTKLETTTTLNADQEGRKRGLKESTVKVEAAYRDLDSTTSGFLDAIMGAVGKTTPAAKNFQRIRSRVRMPDSGPATPVEPVRGGPA